MLKDLIKNVPPYQGFLTVNELYESDERLVRDYPDTVKLKVIGRSGSGFPIRALEIGDGKYRAIAFGFPHPEEPSGSLVLEYLAEKLAENDDFRESFNYTWYVVKCADPDGAKLNEAWFKDFSIKNFALNYYRPPSHKQVEWSFPVKYKNYEWDAPAPETRALMHLIDDVKPDFMCSLHMSGFGGVYFYVSENHPQLFQKFYDLVKAEGLPLHLGEPEVPYRVKFADAIYKMPVFEDSYEYYMEQLGKVPEELKRGTSSYGYARNVSDPFTLVNEVPLLFYEKAADTTPTEIERRLSKLEEIERRELTYNFIKGKFVSVKADLDASSPFYEAVEDYLRRAKYALEAERKWVETDESLRRKATEAEVFDSTIGVILSDLCHHGVFIRLLKASIAKALRKSEVLACLKEVEGRFEYLLKEFEGRAEYEVVPIQKLVRLQLGSLLYAVDYLKQVR